MITLFGREHEERVVLRDPVCGKAIEELRERVVIALQLGNVRGLPRAVGDVDFARDSMLVVRVRDVAERDRDTGFLHLRDIAERGARKQAVEPREAGLAELVADRVAVQIIHGGIATRDGRIHVLGPKQSP